MTAIVLVLTGIGFWQLGRRERDEVFLLAGFTNAGLAISIGLTILPRSVSAVLECVLLRAALRR